MDQQKRVVITISKDGKVRREAFGFVGDECLTRSSFLDHALGAPDSESLKDEYYEDGDIVGDGLPSGHCG